MYSRCFKIESKYKKASEVIDMRKHLGAHPRMGATDVCPIIPVKNISIKECIDISKKLAKKIGDLLNIPIYLYEYSADKNYRKNLPVVEKVVNEIILLPTYPSYDKKQISKNIGINCLYQFEIDINGLYQ